MGSNSTKTHVLQIHRLIGKSVGGTNPIEVSGVRTSIGLIERFEYAHVLNSVQGLFLTVGTSEDFGKRCYLKSYFYCTKRSSWHGFFSLYFQNVVADLTV